MLIHRLMLLRHAKSDWPEGIDDHERPLAKRGRRVSLCMGRYMVEEGLLPDLVIVSTARRAQETWELVRQNFAKNIVQHNERRMYETPPSSILDVICETGSATHTLLLVGHNPGLQSVAFKLIGTAKQSDLVRLQRKYPTAGLIVIDFDIERWSQASMTLGHLERFETPKSVGHAH